MRAAAIALCLAAPATPALADAGTDFLAALSGDWTARGTVQESVDQATETIVCRTASQLSRQGTLLKNTGKCAGAQAKVNVAGSLGYAAATGLLTGNLLTTGTREGGSSTTGRVTATGARLTTVATGARDEVVARGTVDITLEGSNRYTLKVTLTDVASGKQFTAADLTFTRR